MAIGFLLIPHDFSEVSGGIRLLDGVHQDDQLQQVMRTRDRVAGMVQI